MNLKALQAYLFKEEAPDEEKRGDASQDTQGSQDSKKGINHSATAQGGAATDDGDGDMENDDSDTDDESSTSPRGLRRVFSRAWSFIFPAPSDEEEIRAYLPHYRVLPILSGVIIPFSILLEVPGLTQDWYILLQGSTIVDSKHNPPLLDAAIALSILCAVLANTCLVVRFLEKHVKRMTILCILFLSVHDVINTVVLATFGATKHEYTFNQAFWMTLCSTIVSMFTNVTLIVDLVRTPNFARSGSGLTRRQRSLVIIIISLFCYIALGALVNALLLRLSFIDGLFFTVVTIETIGFGDIVPTNTRSRIFVCFYAALGIIHVAFVVGYVRETVLEGLDFGYRRRLLEIQERRRVVHRRRRAERRWRYAITWRLREMHAPVWVPKTTHNHKSIWSTLISPLGYVKRGILSTANRSTHPTHRKPGMQLNLWALPPCQLEAAALEVGVPLDTFLPPGFHDTYDQTCGHTTGAEHRTLPSWFAVHSVYGGDRRCKEPLTYRRLGSMAVILTKLSFFVYESGGNPLPTAVDETEAAGDSSGSLATSGGSYRQDIEYAERKAYFTRSSLSWLWFLVFWMGGAGIFTATEGWTYGLAVYFCFISFTTIGYGDVVPVSPAGRAIFVVWALIGVATMTIFISVVSEVYTSRYKGVLGRNSFNHVVRQYHERTKSELSERVEQIGGLTTAKPVPRDAVAQAELPPVNSVADDGATTSKPRQHAEDARKSLEALPHRVLTEIQSIERYVRVIGDFDNRSVEAVEVVGGMVRRLFDEVMGGRPMTEETVKDIIKDGESRQTLMLLGIERSLKELMDVSEKAVEAVRERDRVITVLEQEMQQDEEQKITT